MIERTDEGLSDILSKIAKAMDPVARAHKKGTKEVTKYTKNSLNHFYQIF